HQRGDDALRRLIGELHLVGAQALQPAAVDGGRGEHLARLAAAVADLLAQRAQVVDRALGHVAELLLLLAAGIDRPAETVDHTLDPAGREAHAAKAAAEAASVPAVTVVAVAPPEPAARTIVVAAEATSHPAARAVAVVEAAVEALLAAGAVVHPPAARTVIL